MKTLMKIEEGGLPAEREERMERQARASRAENSWKAYSSDWKVWTAWAERNGAAAMPAAPEHVAMFLSDMSRTRKPATLRRYLASISVSHTLKGRVFDRKHLAIKTIMRGISRTNDKPVRRVKPLTSDRVRGLLTEMGDGIEDVRDGTLLAIGVASGLRRSELAGLDLQVRGDGDGVLRLTDDGAEIELFSSKTSAEPVVVYIQAGVALAAVKDWIEEAVIEPGTPLFRQIGRSRKVGAGRLSDRGIARIVKRRLAAAGVDPDGFSGHSLRAGCITSAAMAGVPTWRIKRHSRHRSNIVEMYIRPIENMKAALTTEIGL